MASNLPAPVFPGCYRRERVFQSGDEWHTPPYRYSKHLEIAELAKQLKQIATKNGVDWNSTRIRILLNHLEPDPTEIRRRDELVTYTGEHHELVASLLKVRPKNNDEEKWVSNNELRSRFVRHVNNVRSVVTGIRSIEEPNEFYQQVLEQLEPQLASLERDEKELERAYELSADIDLEMRYRRFRRENGLAVTTSQPLKISLFENNEGWQGSSKGRSYDARDEEREMSYIGVGRASASELAIFNGVETEVLRILREQKIRLRLGNLVTAKVRVDVKQEGLRRHVTQASYIITAKGKTIRERVKTRGKAGLPFKEICLEAESEGQREIFERATKNNNAMFDLMRDLATLGGIARLNDVLINQYGGTLGEVLDETDDALFEAEDLHCPLIKFTETEEKPSIPNDFRFTRTQNMGMLTGATANGKTGYEVGAAQTSVMRQANLAVLAKRLRILPRDNIIVQFPDYSGSLRTESSRFAANCRLTKELLKLVTPKTLYIFDEFGGGTDQDELSDLMTTVMGILERRERCFTLASTHYKRLARLLIDSIPGMDAIAFDFGRDGKPTYRGQHGKIATTSQTEYTAEQNGLGKRALRAIERTLEKREK